MRRHGLDRLLCQAEGGELSFVFQTYEYYLQSNSGKHFTWSESHGKCWEKRFGILKFSQDIGVPHLFEQTTVSVADATKLSKSNLTERDKQRWRMHLFNDAAHENGKKLRTYRLFKQDSQLESFVKLPLQRDHHRILALFRCGNLPLHFETGSLAGHKTPSKRESVSTM